MTGPSKDSPIAPALISLAMIVKDGGQLFTSLLEAATGHVDEIIIADTGSSDGSREMARDHGAVVFSHRWTDDFAAARNAALDHCTGQWILVLDADEQLARQDWLALKSWVTERQNSNDQVAVTMMTRNYQPGRHFKRGWQHTPEPDDHGLEGGNPAAGFVPSTKVRLFPNRPEIRFSGQVHETVETSLRSSGLPTVPLNIPVHHFGMLPEYLTPEAQLAKAEAYLRLARRKASGNPHLPCAWAELADCAIATGCHEQARQAIDRALVLNPVNPDYRLTCGWLAKESGDLDEAEKQLLVAAGTSTTSDTVQAEIAHLRAQVAMLRERPREAGPLLEKCLGLVPGNGHFLNTLGAWHLQEGRGEQARLALERARVINPEAVDPLLNLGLLYQAANHPDLAVSHYQLALALDPDNQRAQSALAQLNQESALLV